MYSRGISQGSNWNPLLLMFINGLCESLKRYTLLIADYLKLPISVNCLNDCINFQKNLIELPTWCVKNDIPLI